ncbi:hypothetical protein GALMADRAFT_55661 [Galerina marginata CBS 339.88]|uniref:Thioredoxin-like fold domain-containing protein n=1 Tax=Galerina marginata (strain CBS 339.88) TaxID=685588 RepID=A0A067TP38_GALM3|nr:hypothetical protein GALMADRAFT_55661 [Galerina marginata CBS 339.88]
MRLSAASLSILALAGSVSADYFSAGWSPGQKVEKEAKTVATFVPQASPTATASASVNAPAPKGTPFSFSSLFDMNKLLTSEPAVALFNNFGINITDRVQAALDVKIWDDRVELITDHNYKDLIVNEPLTEEEEKKRVWALVISVTSAKQDGLSKFLDNVFDTAFNETQLAGDLPYVKWGRIDYLNVTGITTKWGVWQAPYLVIATDRGQTLRFYRPHQIRLRDDALREFLKVEGWRVTKPWSSAYAPGGDREYIMEFMAVWFTKIYDVVVHVPRWLMMLLSGGLASIVIGLLHRPSKKAAAAAAAKAKTQVQATSTPKTAAPTNAAPSSITPANTDSEHETTAAAPTKRTSTRQRKNKK